jgi:hypothetical protein
VLHKCANPSCENAFLKLTQGKLFIVETDQASARGLSIVSKKTAQRRIEHYWLCDACAPVLTLAYERGRGIIAIPLTEPPQKMPPTDEFRNGLPAAGAPSASHPDYRRA